MIICLEKFMCVAEKVLVFPTKKKRKKILVILSSEKVSCI